MRDEEHFEAESLDRVVHHLFGSGLSLASILSRDIVDDHVADRLRDAIDGLDAAIRDIRGIALTGMPRRTMPPQAARTVGVAAARSETDAFTSAVQVDGHRFLDRVEDGEPFAYATHGHDFYRVSDNVLWARESGAMLLSARSGLALARRVGSVFHDIESLLPIYQQRLTGIAIFSPASAA